MCSEVRGIAQSGFGDSLGEMDGFEAEPPRTKARRPPAMGNRESGTARDEETLSHSIGVFERRLFSPLGHRYDVEKEAVLSGEGSWLAQKTLK